MNCKRFFAISTVLLLLLALTSCGRIIIKDISDSLASEISPYETEEPYIHGELTYSEYEKHISNKGKDQLSKYLDSLSIGGLDGETVIIASPSTDYIYPDNMSSELSRFVAERNSAIEELLEIRLVSRKVSINTLSRELKQSSLAGKSRYDVLMLPLNEIGRFVYDGLLIDMFSECEIELLCSYFNISSASAASFGGAVYGIAGDGSVMPTSISAVYMNTEILRDAGVNPQKLYTDAANGNWTWDEFLRCTDAVGGIEKFNTVTSQSIADSFSNMVFTASGNNYLSFDENGIATVGYDPESAANAVEYISALMNDSSAVISSEYNSIGDFAKEKTAFALEHLYVMSWLVNSDAQWGILPVPKSDESDIYRSLMAKDTLLFAIPTVSHDKQTSADVITALNAASEGYIYEQFIQYNMINVLRDNESVNMLDIVLDSAVFDRGVTYGERFPSLAAITELVKNSAAEEDWAKTYDTMAKEANKILKDELPIYFVEDEPPETEAPETEIPETDAPETKPAETKPAETKPAETKPAETKPAETKPAETKPAETKPAETKPAETKPAETKPAETKPAETKPAETKPAETKPAETKPEETTPPEILPPESEPTETTSAPQ